MPSQKGDEGSGQGGRTGAAVVLGLAGLLCFHCVANVWWLGADDHAIHSDEALHMGYAGNYLEVFCDTATSPYERVLGLLDLRSKYPPLMHVMGAIVAMPFGGSPDGIAFTTTLLFLALIAGVFALCRCFLPACQALFAACVVSLTPIIYASSRYFSQDFLSAVIVVWCVYALVKSEWYQRTGWVFAFSLLNGLGFLARWTTCVFYLLPCAVVVVGGLWRGWSACTRGEERRSALKRVLLNAALTVVVSVGVFAPWYLLNLKTMYAEWRPYVAEKASSLEQAVPKAGEVGTSAGFWAGYLIFAVNSMFVPLAALGVIGLAASFGRRIRGTPILLIFLWLVGSYVLLTAVIPVRTPRYMIPMLPSLGIFAAVAVIAIPWARVRAAVMVLVTALLLCQFGNLSVASYGRFAKLELPVLAENRYVRYARNDGLVILSDEIIAGAYVFHAPTEENWIRRVFGAMARTDKERRYVTSDRANYVLVGTGPVGMGFAERACRPMVNPLNPRSARVEKSVSPLVPLRPRMRSTTIAPALPHQGSESATGTYFVCPIALVVPGEMTLEFEAAETLEAVVVDTAPGGPTLAEYDIQYFDEAAAEYRDTSPPCGLLDSPSGYHYHQFEAIRTSRIRLRVRRATDGANLVTLRRLDFHRVIPQHRGAALIGHGAEPETVADKLPYADYVVYWTWSARPEEVGKTEEFFAQDFEVVERFDAGAIGRGRSGTFTVMGRKQRPTVSFMANRAFRVAVSEDHWPNGRWDVPWWRFHYPVVNPRGLAYWACSVPGLADVDLGGVYDLYGLEVVPYTEELGVRKAAVQYWEAGEGTWRELGPGQVRIDVPKVREGDERWIPKTIPVPWDRPVRTDRVRIIVFEGGTDTDYGHVAYVSNVFIYGERVSKAVSTDISMGTRIAECFMFPAVPALADGSVEIDEAQMGRLTWTTPPCDGGGDHVFEFEAVSFGGGTVELYVDGEPAVAFLNTPAREGLWCGNGVEVAYRPVDKGVRRRGTYRVIVPQERIVPGESLEFGVGLVSARAGSWFAVAGEPDRKARPVGAGAGAE